MNIMKSDINNYDYLSVKIKKSDVSEIINYYQKFQWILVEQFDDKRYDNVCHVSFKRNHFIPKKDEILLLQVYLENELNRKGKINKMKHSKTISLGVSIVLIGVGLISIGFLLLLLQSLIILGTTLMLSGLIEFIYLSFNLHKIYHNQEVIYSQNINKCIEKINKILQDLEILI